MALTFNNAAFPLLVISVCGDINLLSKHSKSKYGINTTEMLFVQIFPKAPVSMIFFNLILRDVFAFWHLFLLFKMFQLW